MYISDCGYGRIRLFTASNGIITTVAGGGTDYDNDNGSNLIGDNGAATSAILSRPRGIVLDLSGRYNFSVALHEFTYVVFRKFVHR